MSTYADVIRTIEQSLGLRHAGPRGRQRSPLLLAGSADVPFVILIPSLIVVAVVVRFVGAAMVRDVDPTKLWLFSLFLSCGLVGVAMSFRRRALEDRTQRDLERLDFLRRRREAHRTGKYAKGLEMLRELDPDDSEMDMFRGSSLYHLGRLEESVSCYRVFLEHETRPGFAGVALDGLGWALLDLGRYAEAERAFTAASKLKPEWGDPYSGRAQLRLEQGIEPELARELARKATTLDGRRSADVQKHGLSQSTATEAWAEAAMGNAAECQHLLQRAVALNEDSSIPALASIHYKSGRAMVTLGLREKAAGHFEEASRLEPEGHFGAISRRFLAFTEASRRS